MHRCDAKKQEFLQVVGRDILKDGRCINSAYGKVGALASSAALSGRNIIVVESNEAIHSLILAT